jgi:hypothetical protein
MINNLHLSLLIIAILLIVYLAYNLKYKRRIVLNNLDLKTTEGFSKTIEGFEPAENEVKDVVAKYNRFNNIQSISDKYATMALHEYCIKASYNSACSGKYISENMVKEVLKRGCRFLDFEVFHIKENNIFKPMVAVSSDKSYILLDTRNSVLLDKILTTVATTAFSQGSPNNKDPVFINLRIKSKDSNIYHAVASSIDATLKSVVYNDKISKETKLKDVIGKVVIIVDKTVEYDYKQYTACDSGATNCYDLTKYMNLESGSEYLNLYYYTDLLGHAKKPILVKDDNMHTTSKIMKMVQPDIVVNNANPSYKEFIVNHGCQNLLCQFQIVDENLKKYEEFFNDMNGGIVPLSGALKYFTK